MYYEMYNIHKQAQSEKKANKKSKESSKENLVEKDGEKIQPPVIITINDEGEPSAAEKKKRKQEDLVTDFVKILEQMMNPRQAVTSFLGGASGLLSLITASIYCSSIPDNAQQTKQLVIILIVYGIIQMFMAISFFSTCMSTSIAVHRGVKHASQILFGLLVALAYAIFSIIAIFVGILGRPIFPDLFVFLELSNQKQQKLRGVRFQSILFEFLWEENGRKSKREQ
ncbi:hypothetical protein WR25_14454 [Diploscapter pachys]|uniref:Uncharacterized protein n=1 Tax=Diploscapter pachys TaxID=2018661 RepID=A0A2A2LD55_9BILA|nr:hypothetical protein WR25_14454 [Diploscapter pachys]